MFVYIREAHPSGELTFRGKKVLPRRPPGFLSISQPRNKNERHAAAALCVKELKLSMYTVVDDLHDTTAAAYAAFPDRLFLIETDGRVLYRSAPGPAGFRPEELAGALAKRFPEAPER